MSIRCIDDIKGIHTADMYAYKSVICIDVYYVVKDSQADIRYLPGL